MKGPVENIGAGCGPVVELTASGRIRVDRAPDADDFFVTPEEARDLALRLLRATMTPEDVEELRYAVQGGVSAQEALQVLFPGDSLRAGFPELYETQEETP